MKFGMGLAHGRFLEVNPAGSWYSPRDFGFPHLYFSALSFALARESLLIRKVPSYMMFVISHDVSLVGDSEPDFEGGKFASNGVQQWMSQRTHLSKMNHQQM